MARVFWNLSVPALYEEAVSRREASISVEGPLVCRTGQHTGRSPNDKFIVREPSSEDKVWWSKVNRPIESASFDAIHQRLLNYVEGKELFVQDCYAGADTRYRLPVRIITEQAWHSLFARHMFIEAPDAVGRAAHTPEFTVIDMPGLTADPKSHGTNSEVFILLNFAKKLGPDRRHQLRGRDQEVDLHRDELHAAAAERHVDALLGQRRQRRATWRSSSVFPVPARRRSRAIHTDG